MHRCSKRREARLRARSRKRKCESLPMNGRNFLDLALLVPGVSPTNIGSTQLFAETSAVPGQGISIGSQRNFSNNFIVDGLSANDDAAGLSGIPYGVDAVDQFQVVTSGGQAELGRALGRLHQRRDQERHEYGARRSLWLLSRRCLNATNAPCRASEAADESEAIRREHRAGRSRGTGRSTSRTSSSAGWIRPAWPSLRTGERQRHQRAAGGGSVSGLADLDGHLSESCRLPRTSWRRSTIRSAAAISSASATVSTTSRRATRAAPVR